MAVFGAEQVRDRKTKLRYFDVYYAVVNTSGLIAFGAIAYIQINTNYFIGYLIPCTLLIVAFGVFLIGYTCYIHTKLYNGLLIDFLRVLIGACQSWRAHRTHRTRIIERSQSSDEPSTIDDNIDRSLPVNTRSVRCFLDYAKSDNNAGFVNGVINDMKSFRRIMAVFLLLIPYWLICIQVDNTSMFSHRIR
jgi:hypothetical protein